MNSATQPRQSGTYERAHVLPHRKFKPTARQSAEKATRLLLVSDEPQRLNAWRKALLGQPCEITEQTISHNAMQIPQRTFDLVVVDVPADQLGHLLSTIRATEGQIPVLVDASRLPEDLSFAGVLPQFRAMACTRPDLLRLIQQYCKPTDKLARARQLL